MWKKYAKMLEHVPAALQRRLWPVWERLNLLILEHGIHPADVKREADEVSYHASRCQ
jgi:hypothetical protein